MNNERRKEIEKARGLIEEAKAILINAQADEETAYDNMPESMQGSERGEKVQAAADTLQTAVDSLEEVDSNLEEAIS